MARALQSRAKLDSMDGACREYAAAEKLARNERYPWISFLEVTHRITAIPDRGAWGFKFEVDLPFFRSAAAAEARLAAAQRHRCEVERQALETRIRHEVADAVTALDAAWRELAELDRLRAGPAERAVERMRAALQLGRADAIPAL